MDYGKVALSQSIDTKSAFDKRELVPKRLLALPTLMSTPPTITLGERNGTPLISSGVQHLACDFSTGVINPIFRFIGDPQRFGTSFPDNNYVKNMAVTTSSSNGNLVVEFSHYGSKLELREAAKGGKYRIAVDEGNGYSYVSADAQDASPALGGIYLRLVDFGSVKFRSIRVEYSSTMFGGVIIGPNDTLTPPLTPPKPRAIIFGDSFTEAGSSGASISHGYASILCELLGWECWNSGVGGTGYIATGVAGSGRTNFQGRVLQDIISYSPDIVVIAGGINDESYPISDVEKAVRLLVNTICSALPNTMLITLSNFAPAGNPPSNRLAIRDVIKTVSKEYGASFVDVLEGGSYNESGDKVTPKTGSWITGSGNTGNVQATGNASLFISSDATHPTKEGHAYLGRRVATEIYRIYNN